MPSKPDFAEFYKRHFEAVYRICYIFMQNTAKNLCRDRLKHWEVTLNEQKY